MVLLSALAAISAISLQGGTLTLAGKVVQITYPEAPVRQIPEDVKNWDGFMGLPVAQREWPTPFKEAGDWSPIVSKLETVGLPSKDAPDWKVKVFILTQTDTLIGGGQTPFRQIRHRLDQKQVDLVLRSLARVPGYIRAATDGVLKTTLDVSIDVDPFLIDLVEGSPNPYSDYTNARVNQGRFDAEDKLYRGPYHAVVVIPASKAAQYLANDSPTRELEEDVVHEIASQAHLFWARLNIPSPPRSGIAGGDGVHLPSLFPSEIWRGLQSSTDPGYETLAKFYQLADQVRTSRADSLEIPSRQAPISNNVSVAISPDDQRGPVLKYSESSPTRKGGFALPFRNVDPQKTPYLSFWVKSNSHDSVALQILDGSSKGGPGRFQPLIVVKDGSWNQVTVDLRTYSAGPIDAVVVGPQVTLEEREQIGNIIYLFDDFQLLATGNANQPDFSPIPEIYRTALAAKTLSAQDLVKETSDLVKLNGLISKDGTYGTSDEAALIELTKSVNVRIARQAVIRLAQLGTPSAKTEILRLVTASPFDQVKQVAAVEVGRFGDPKTAGILSRLFASKSWQTRMSGAKGLTMLPGDDAAVISMTFLQETDPQIRLAVTRGANTKNSVVIKRLLWSAINDPSDAVRAESAWKLIQSGKPKEAAEGYKVIRDDSVGVRLHLLNRFALEPSEGHRDAIRVAIADSSPFVRANALRTLAKQPGEVSIDEVTTVLEDKFPIVQFALIDLAATKKFVLPASALANLRSSIDFRIVEKAKGLGQ
ncbi:MAG: hypothetical protein H7Y17_01445 [Chlorobia bacterium]|nr:hypothetical protein [Fimbriimonadaceae bacterium]